MAKFVPSYIYIHGKEDTSWYSETLVELTWIWIFLNIALPLAKAELGSLMVGLLLSDAVTISGGTPWSRCSSWRSSARRGRWMGLTSPWARSGSGTWRSSYRRTPRRLLARKVSFLIMITIKLAKQSWRLHVHHFLFASACLAQRATTQKQTAITAVQSKWKLCSRNGYISLLVCSCNVILNLGYSYSLMMFISVVRLSWNAWLHINLPQKQTDGDFSSFQLSFLLLFLGLSADFLGSLNPLGARSAEHRSQIFAPVM